MSRPAGCQIQDRLILLCLCCAHPLCCKQTSLRFAIDGCCAHSLHCQHTTDQPVPYCTAGRACCAHPLCCQHVMLTNTIGQLLCTFNQCLPGLAAMQTFLLHGLSSASPLTRRREAPHGACFQNNAAFWENPENSAKFSKNSAKIRQNSGKIRKHL